MHRAHVTERREAGPETTQARSCNPVEELERNPGGEGELWRVPGGREGGGGSWEREEGPFCRRRVIDHHPDGEGVVGGLRPWAAGLGWGARRHTLSSPRAAAR